MTAPAPAPGPGSANKRYRDIGPGYRLGVRERSAVSPDQRPLFDALHRFALTMGRPSDLTDALFEIGGEFADMLGAVGAGIDLCDRRGRLRFVTATNQACVASEQASERARAGPCHDAVHCGEVVAVDDIASHRDRWPVYCETAARHGLAAVLGLPMMVDGQCVGGVTVYDYRRQWSAADLVTGALLAEMAGAYIPHAEELVQSRHTAEQLQTALMTRVVIEQAKGKLAGKHNISVDAAFEAIRHHARSHNAKVHNVATAIVEGDLDIIDLRE